MRTRFCAEVCPDTISTLVLGTPKYSDNTRQTSMLALPFSGTACTLTRSTPSSVLPATSLRVERGMTLTLMMNDSPDTLIRQFVQCRYQTSSVFKFYLIMNRWRPTNANSAAAPSNTRVSQLPPRILASAAVNRATVLIVRVAAHARLARTA
jgi:hypothetical protein